MCRERRGAARCVPKAMGEAPAHIAVGCVRLARARRKPCARQQHAVRTTSAPCNARCHTARFPARGDRMRGSRMGRDERLLSALVACKFCIAWPAVLQPTPIERYHTVPRRSARNSGCHRWLIPTPTWPHRLSQLAIRMESSSASNACASSACTRAGPSTICCIILVFY